MQKIEYFSSLIIPCILLITALIILFGKRDYFSSFLSGAKDGAISACRLLPTLCALVVGVSAFSASGASDFLSDFLSPVCDFLHIPSGIFPLILTRPLSGGASIATFEEILSKYGADSFEALCASLIMACSDTVIYVISVYFSTSTIKRTRYALPCALFVSAVSIFICCIAARIFFF